MLYLVTKQLKYPWQRSANDGGDVVGIQLGLGCHDLQAGTDHAVYVEGGGRGGVVEHAGFDLGADPEADQAHAGQQDDQVGNQELRRQRRAAPGNLRDWDRSWRRIQPHLRPQPLG